MQLKVLMFAAMASVATVTAAQTPAPSADLVDALTACRSETDASRRLACYDSASSSLAAAKASGTIVVVDREDVRETRRSLFGFSLPKLPFFSGDDSSADTPDEIEARIQSVRGLGYGKFLFTLESGARWQTTEANNRPPDPKAGDTIRIKKGALGAYFLSVDGGRSVKGMRVG